MKQEALEELPGVRDEFEAAVRSVSSGKPDGLNVVALRERIEQHPQYDVELSMKYLHVWLAELSRDGVVVYDEPNRRYLLAKYADKDPDAYRRG